jgi:hypothetical protein
VEGSLVNAQHYKTVPGRYPAHYATLLAEWLAHIEFLEAALARPSARIVR